MESRANRPRCKVISWELHDKSNINKKMIEETTNSEALPIKQSMASDNTYQETITKSSQVSNEIERSFDNKSEINIFSDFINIHYAKNYYK
ncbi:hypothetical protein PIROE2DRAFT_6015 [Piromyces sp. E2]|nr:hypothetical protein PIROE2DRAFT_6015 [Piromyces sp. E2]|eukprot:OUM66700.1 hypothetical protein PIROE2DRAFT_6015 [Piromyces sp. E2]